MSTTSHTALRELDRRHSDGIDVRLLWNPHTNRVSVAVRDERSGDSMAFDVAGADALEAFQHPYAYAPAAEPACAPIHVSQPRGRTR